MTVQEFIQELETAKEEARAYKSQMEVNNTYACCYASALQTIAELCGAIESGAFSGNPPDDIDAIAIRAVTKAIKTTGEPEQSKAE